MAGTVTTPKYATWTAPGFPFRIEYSGEVLDQIRMAAVEGYHRVPHGGVETGGILYGTHPKTAVRIKAWRPIECEYSKGPSFLLSGKEEAALAETLKTWRDDPELARLEPVGWYRAHTRSEILLSDADQAFFNRFFPQPWQIALIVRPASFTPTRAGYFFREPGGHVRTESSYREFVLTPAAVRRAPAPVEPVSPEPEPDAPQPPLPVVEAAIPEPPPAAPPPPQPALPPPQPTLRHALEFKPYEPPRFPRKPPRRQFWYGSGVLAIAILGFALLRPSHPSLALAATDLRGHLRISWDRNARPVTHATGGQIEIDDHGARTQVKLTPADLRSGTVFYERQSGDVSVRLTVDVPGTPPIAETAHFLRLGEAAQSPAPRQDTAGKAATPATAVPKAEQARVAPPSPAVPRPPASPPSAQADTERPVIAFHAPEQAAHKSSAEIPAIAPPSIDDLPAAPPTGLTSVLGSAPHPAPAPAAPPHQASTVSNGRIIWTGRLSRNGRLIIERNRASSGSVVGALPGVVAHVNAYPGDLTAGGITLFTADPRYTQPVTEKAGADNGWNSTTYTWDPKRAAGIRIEEQPSPQNGFKLVLQCDISKLSVLMLEWSAP